MTAIARYLARRVISTQTESDTLKTVGLLCGAGLLVSLLLITYGLDLSAAFF